MTQETNVAAEPQAQALLAQVEAQVTEFRDSIFQTVIEKNFTPDVVFNAMQQAVAGFIFDYLLTNAGEINDDNLKAVLDRFSQQTEATASRVLENMRESVRKQQEEEAPKIIVAS